MATLVGKKCGMTRIFTEDGVSIPVTIIEIQANRVVHVKTPEKDGYSSVQVTTGQKKLSRLSKPLQGHYAKAKVEAGSGLWELPMLENGDSPSDAIGTELTVDIFTEGEKVDVTGITKGKGFAGVVKRHHFRTQDATHGNSLSHRAPGSIGQRQTPGRVFKGKKMAGHLGVDRRTIQNQTIVKIDKEHNLLFVKGAIPGAPGVMVVVKSAIKRKR